ncbi:MAG: hypothetical protein ACTHLR_03710 [Rhizomicrobium sp.]
MRLSHIAVLAAFLGFALAAPATAQPSSNPPNCFVNAGAVAKATPCRGRIGTVIKITLLRNLALPLGWVIFKPYETALPQGTGADITLMVRPGTTVSKTGQSYNFFAPPQLCINNHNGSFDIWLQDKKKQNLGDIGRFLIWNCP